MVLVHETMKTILILSNFPVHLIIWAVQLLFIRFKKKFDHFYNPNRFLVSLLMKRITTLGEKKY